MSGIPNPTSFVIEPFKTEIAGTTTEKGFQYVQ